MKRTIFLGLALVSSIFAGERGNDPLPGDPLNVLMGQRKPIRVRVARNQATLIRLPEGQRVMNVYGGDRGDGGVWSIDAGKIPTRFVAVKPKETGIHTTLHVVSNTGQEISFLLQEVTGADAQFDAEVDAKDDVPVPGSALPEVRWVPADEVASCRQKADTAQVEAATAERKAREEAAAAIAKYQSEYPKKLFFGYEWDRKQADRLGFQAIWADDKFTYIRASHVLALYEIQEGKPSLVQYGYSNGLYTVAKVLYDGYFAIGPKKENKLTFHRSKS